MNNELYRLWLSNIPGIGHKKRTLILDYFGSPKEAFEAGNDEMKGFIKGGEKFSKKDESSVLESRDVGKIMEMAHRINKSGITFISSEHKEYPHSLKHIFDPPDIVYYKGHLPSKDQRMIAMVGARRCTPYGSKVAEILGKNLSEAGLIVVSGMARGIDSAAHEGAIKGKGNTLAVLGCGVDICYPPENIRLMEKIEENGCILSEYPPGTLPIPGNFPMRNRIISGLSDGVVIVEAALRSGSLITADSALEQGKTVFAVPGRAFERSSEGTNNLLKMGAKLVTSIEDILEEFHDYPGKRVKNEQKNQLMLDKSEQIVYSCISLAPVTLEQLQENTALSLQELYFNLMKLELKNLIEQLPNQTYIHTV